MRSTDKQRHKENARSGIEEFKISIISTNNMREDDVVKLEPVLLTSTSTQLCSGGPTSLTPSTLFSITESSKSIGRVLFILITI